MSDNPTSARANAPEPSTHQAAALIDKRPWWKTVALIAIVLTATGLIIFSSIRFDASNKYSPFVEWPSHPSHIDESPVHIDTIQEAWGSYNNLVLVIIPCGDATLNDSITAIAVQAANKIRTQDKIYVGVFVLPQDDYISYPIVRLRLYTIAAQGMPKEMTQDITENLIHNTYLDRKFLRT